MVKKRVMGSLYFNDTPVDVSSEYDGQLLTIGDTIPGKEITWVEVNGLLIADRCVCTHISGFQLKSMGYANGKPVEIDAQRYLCRLLKVGTAPDVPNEWDAALDATGEDNGLWHWKGALFWGKETDEKPTPYRALRGYVSARNFEHALESNRFANPGFRPVLETLD